MPPPFAAMYRVEVPVIALLQTLLIAAVIVMAAPTVLVFFIVMTRSRPTMKLELTDTVASELPEEVRRFLGDAVQAASSDGFVVFANRRTTSHAPTVGYTLDMINRDAGDFASTIFTTSGPVFDSGVIYTTSFADGRTIATVNTRIRTFLPVRPDVDALALPHVRDARQVYAAHRRRVEQLAAGKTPVLPPPGEETKCLEEDRAKNQRWFIGCGYFRMMPSGEQCRPTVRGGIMMALKMAWPGKRIRAWLINRRERAELKKLGLAHLIDPL